MVFRETRLWQLTQWFLSACVTFILFVGYVSFVNNIADLRNHPGYVQAVEDLNKLSNQKSVLLNDIQSNVDELIMIDKQLIQLEQKENDIISSMQRVRMIFYYMMIALGVLCLLMSIFFGETVRVMLAVIGAIFVIVGTVWSFTSTSLHNAIMVILLAAASYALWYFLIKKYPDARRYVCFQILAIFGFAYGLTALELVVLELIENRYFTQNITTFYSTWDAYQEARNLLLKEQKDLLTHEQLSKEQKKDYIKLYDKLKNMESAWENEVQKLGEQMHTKGMGDVRQIAARVLGLKAVALAFFAILLLGGMFLPSLLSFGFILSGIGNLLIGLYLLLTASRISQSALLGYAVYGYSLFVILILLFIAYRLYHEKSDVATS